MERSLITIGEFVNAHGIKGEIKLRPRGMDARQLTGCKTLYIGDEPFVCTSRRVHKGCLLVKLESVDDMNGALAFKGCEVRVPREDISLPPGGYFDEELIGLTARNAETGKELGTLEEVLPYPAHRIYVVRKGKHEYLIPAVPEFIAGIDMAEGVVNIYMMDGLES